MIHTVVDHIEDMTPALRHPAEGELRRFGVSDRSGRGCADKSDGGCAGKEDGPAKAAEKEGACLWQNAGHTEAAHSHETAERRELADAQRLCPNGPAQVSIESDQLHQADIRMRSDWKCLRPNRVKTRSSSETCDRTGTVAAIQFFLTATVFFCRKDDSECHVWNEDVLVCSCNYITDKEIREVINELLEQDCWQLIVPAKVYHAMEKRGRCCGCFPNVVDIIIQTTEEYHARRHSTEDGNI